jgi:electron transfer flavoprotein beta subunit
VGARVPLTEDAREIDTRHLGFTIGPHEECAVEEAVRQVAVHGGRVTVLAVGPPGVEEQLRYSLAMGADRGVRVDAGASELDPEATSGAIVHAVRALTADAAAFDLLLFGNESADCGHYQVGVRVAHELGLPIVGGIKGIRIDDEVGCAPGGYVELRRDVTDGVEVYRLPLPAAAAVKEGLNLPRYPTMRGRVRARKAVVGVVAVEPAPGGLRMLRLRQPRDERAGAVLLGRGAAAAPAIVDVLEDLGVV